MSDSKNRIKAKVVKLENISSNKIAYIDVGDEFFGYFIEEPTIDKYFTLYNDNANKLSDFIHLRTTEVKEIIDDRTFKTRNSIYKITTLSDERQDKLNTILNEKEL
jgi:hypothetical protein